MKQLNPNNKSVIQPLLESSLRGAAWMRMFFMLVLMVMSSAFAMAQEAYGIKIAGVEVTSENCADLSVIEGVSGKVSFDAATNTLTLDNANIVNAKEEAILNDRCEGLVIKVLGKNNITAADSAGIRIVQSTTILGVGASSMLNVKSDYSALAMCNVPLTIQYCQVIAVGNYGISGSGQYDDELTIRKSYVVAKGAEGALNADEDYGSIAKIADLNLEDCYITMPNDAKFDNNLGGVAVDGWLTSGKVVIEPNGYGIKVAGEEVTALNCNDLSVIDGVEGKMSYNFDTNTLTMEDVTINATDARIGILIDRNSHVKIKVVGNNSITTDDVCISLKNESSISGPGTFRLKSHNNCGIFMRREVDIDSVKLYVEGKWGIAGYDGKSSEVLVITDSYVEATGSYGSVCDLSGFWLDGSVITQPAGAAYDTELYALALDGEVVTDKVIIEPDNNYGIKIAGKNVTPQNCKDLSVIKGVRGKVSYNPETNTLTMEDAAIVSIDNGISVFNNENVKIEVVGNDTIDTNASCISLLQASTISGSGTLRLLCDNNYYCGIFMRSSLTVEGVKLYADAKWGFGIAGQQYGKNGEVLTLRNAYVEATGVRGSVCDLQDLILDGCAISQPAGAAFDADLHAVMLNGEVVTDKVVIEPSASGINDITADVPARKKGVFTVQGVKQTQSWNELPAGIYIVDGVKRVKR